MKIYYYIYIVNIFSFIICQDYIYSPSDVINFINSEIEYSEDDYTSFLDNLSKTFSDAYAFNDISKNPTQPDFNSNYFNKVDIQKELNEIDLTDISPYEFYRKTWTILSKLKDMHIQMKWKPLNLDQFYILGPIDYSVKEDEDGSIKIYGVCLEDSELEDFENYADISEICQYYSDTPIKSINDIEPFEFINNFGGNFLETKNTHGTFSFKLRYHNNVPLSDYPLSLEELQSYKVEFESGDIFETEYIIKSDIDIESNRLRNLNPNNKLKKKIYKKSKNEKLSKLRNSRDRPLQLYYKLIDGQIVWDYECEDILKCSADTVNQVNIYYITSFQPSNRDDFNKTIQNCYKLFDDNIYPIIVINDLNNGGYVSLN